MKVLKGSQVNIPDYSCLIVDIIVLNDSLCNFLQYNLLKCNVQIAKWGGEIKKIVFICDFLGAGFVEMNQNEYFCK